MKTSDQEKYNRAKKKVIQLKHLYDHLFFFVFINLGLAALNYYQNKLEYPWFYWSIGSWIVVLIAHLLYVYTRFPKWGSNSKWEKRKINEILKEKEQTQRWE